MCGKAAKIQLTERQYSILQQIRRSNTAAQRLVRGGGARGWYEGVVRGGSTRGVKGARARARWALDWLKH